MKLQEMGQGPSKGKEGNTDLLVMRKVLGEHCPFEC